MTTNLTQTPETPSLAAEPITVITHSAVLWKPGRTMDDTQAETIAQSLVHFGGNKSLAARELQISVRKIRVWVAKHPRLAAFRVLGPQVGRVV